MTFKLRYTPQTVRKKVVILVYILSSHTLGPGRPDPSGINTHVHTHATSPCPSNTVLSGLGSHRQSPLLHRYLHVLQRLRAIRPADIKHHPTGGSVIPMA